MSWNFNAKHFKGFSTAGIVHMLRNKEIELQSKSSHLCLKACLTGDKDYMFRKSQV